MAARPLRPTRRDAPGYFSREYKERVDARNPSWIALRAVCFAMTWGRDAIFPLLKARQLDHLHYRSLNREIPLVDVVPLAFSTHALVTALRDKGLRGPTNFALRLAGLGWIAFDLCALTVVALVASGHWAELFRLMHAAAGAPQWLAHVVGGARASIR